MEVPSAYWDGQLLYSKNIPAMSTIYGLCNKENRRVFYVGQSVEPWTRYGNHRRLYGANIAMFELERVPIQDAGAAELRWMRHYINAGCRLMNKQLPEEYSCRRILQWGR